MGHRLVRALPAPRSATRFVAVTMWLFGAFAVVASPAGATAHASRTGSGVSGWSLDPTQAPSGATNTSFQAVSCLTAKVCTAVSTYTSTSRHEMTLAEAWDGTTWTIEATPNPVGETEVALDGVSCTATTACMAVGSYMSPQGHLLTLAEAWDGTTWRIQPTPDHGGGTSVLAAVSCASATTCIAVGYYVDRKGAQRPLVERWDGATWAKDPSAKLDGNGGYLAGVSCPSPSDCTAVGAYGSTQGAESLAEAWNGTRWKVEPTPTGLSSTYAELLAVSCESPTACSAVGEYHSDNANQNVTLAEGWDGVTWTFEKKPAPSLFSFLQGVSCTTPTACTAVGFAESYNGGPKELSELWNGSTWQVEPTVRNPGGSAYGDWFGVSCTPDGGCTAVGSYGNSLRPLAETKPG